MAANAIKSGHHQFDPHFVSNHEGVYLQFNACDLFDTGTMDRTHESYMKLWMGQQYIVERYIE